MTTLVSTGSRDLFGARTSAVMSADGVYRYELCRTWDTGLPPLWFIMLNPSTADALADDPTIRRCVAFAKREHAGGIVVVNLFALRATNPAALHRHADPVGPDADRFYPAHADARVVVAWGAHEFARERAARAADLLAERNIQPHCLGTTTAGAPRHPLYLAADTPLAPWTADPNGGA